MLVFFHRGVAHCVKVAVCHTCRLTDRHISKNEDCIAIVVANTAILDCSSS